MSCGGLTKHSVAICWCTEIGMLAKRTSTFSCLWKSDRIATFSINPKRVHLVPSSVSSVLRLLHQDAAMSPEGMTCTPAAPPGLPVHSTPVLMATKVWAPATAGELQSFSTARSQSFNLFLKPVAFFFLHWNWFPPTKNTLMTHYSRIKTIMFVLISLISLTSFWTRVLFGVPV